MSFVGTTTFEGCYISGREAQRLTGLSPTKLYRLAAIGVIRATADPGRPIRYVKHDVLKVCNIAGQ